MANQAPVPYNIRYSKVLSGCLPSIRDLRVISLIREPVSREISNAFQLGSRAFESFKDLRKDIDEEKINCVVKEIGSKIEELALQGNYYNRWFNREIG